FTTAFKNLKAFAGPVYNAASVPHAGKIKALATPGCCICRQALFIAPCSHTVLQILEEDVEVDEGSWEIDISEEDGEGRDNKHPTPIPSGAEGDGDNDGPGIISGGEGDDDRMDVDQDLVVRPEVVLEEPESDEGEPCTAKEIPTTNQSNYHHPPTAQAPAQKTSTPTSLPLPPVPTYRVSPSVTRPLLSPQCNGAVPELGPAHLRGAIRPFL
ncbi:hypothetical protein P691DRAFT_805040, partial [Macrolepiota fuliginosa MF-IS2]